MATPGVGQEWGSSELEWNGAQGWLLLPPLRSGSAARSRSAVAHSVSSVPAHRAHGHHKQTNSIINIRMAKQLPTHAAYAYFTQLTFTSKQRPANADPKAKFFSCGVVDSKGKLCGAHIRFFSVSNLIKHIQTAHPTISLEQSTLSGTKRSIATMLLASPRAAAGRAAAPPEAAAAAASAAEFNLQSHEMDIDELFNHNQNNDSVSLEAESNDISSPPAAKRSSAATSSRSSAASVVSTSSAGRNAMQQTKLTPHVIGVQNPNDCLLMALVMNGWPLRITEDIYFRRFIQSIQRSPNFPMELSRYRIRSAILRKQKQLKMHLVKELRVQRVPVSLVLDGWTNVVHNKVTNILLVSRSKAYYWCSLTNATERNTAAYLSAVISPIIENIEMEGIPVVSYVADNEAVMTATHEILEGQYPQLIRIPCAAHTIQLIVRKLLTEEMFARPLNEYVELLNNFATKKELRLALRNAQPLKSHRAIIRPCETRWSYTLISIQRSLLLRNYITQALQQLNMVPPQEHFWGSLADISTVLQPFAVATNNIQKDSAVLCDVAREFFSLRKHADKIQQQHPVIGELIHSCIVEEWDSHVNVEAAAACGLLSQQDDLQIIFKPHELISAQRFIKQWAAKYFEHYRFFVNIENVAAVVDRQLTDFLANDGCFGEIDFPSRLRNSGPVKAWNSMLIGPKELAQVAIALLSICASEAAAERSFSLQDRIHSKLRNRSKEDLVEAQMFIKMNSSLLDKSVSVTRNAKPDSEEEVLSLEMGDDTNEPRIHLDYLNVVSAVVVDAAEVMEARVVLEPNAVAPNLDIQDAGEMEDSDFAVSSESDQEADILEPIAIASQIQENQLLHDFIAKHKLQGKCRIVGDLENDFSNEVEAHKPRIKSQLRDLKARLLSILKTIPK